MPSAHDRAIHAGDTLTVLRVDRLAALVLVIVVMAMASPRASGAPAPERGQSKILILLPIPSVSAPPELALDNVKILEDYHTALLGVVAEKDIEEVRQRALARGATVAVHDEYDLLGLPGGVIDTRLGIVPPPRESLTQDYPEGRHGLYVVQLIGPPKREWLSEMTAAGAVIAEAIPLNGYLLAMTPRTAAAVRSLRFVQFLDVYHPFLKAAMVDREGKDARDVAVQLADVPGIKDETAGEVAAFLEGVRQKTDRSGFFLRGRVDSSRLASILAHPLVLGVHALTPLRVSDERQATSVSANVTSSGTPANPTGYASWLAGACTFCGNLSSEGFIVGIADTGVDTGPAANPSRHLDLQPVGRVRYGTVFLGQRNSDGSCPPGDFCEEPEVCSYLPLDERYYCDYYHGTFVAATIAGNAGTGKLDTTVTEPPEPRFFLGTGVLPSAGILSTKIATTGGIIPFRRNDEDNDIFDWAPDATSFQDPMSGVTGVYIQSHSHNEYGNPDARGKYTLVSRQFDFAVRDSDGTGTVLSPITLTVSAGNRSQDPGIGDDLLLPPATAKNVIAMGGAENVRHPSEWREPRFDYETELCVDPPIEANSFLNVESDTKKGTVVVAGTPQQGWNTFNKPDLFAPASQLVGARSVVVKNAFPRKSFNCWGYGGDPPGDDHDYVIITGTSFAAPVGAAGALVASRAYSAWLGGMPNPGSASPALRKAVLVAAARSMKGGIDKTTITNPTIGARPSPVQGFGRISLVDIVSQSPARQYVDQSPARTFTQSLQKWSATYPVSDPSKPVKIVLTWTDAPAPANLGSVPTWLENDLDLTVDVGHSTLCRQYAGNNLEAPTPPPSAEEPERSILYQTCEGGNADTKNNVEQVIFFPNAVNPPVTQFTVLVYAKRVSASAIPDTDCGGADCVDQDFALFAFNAGAPVALAVPGGVSAAATSDSTVSVTWSPVLGATNYEISRTASVAGAWECCWYTVANAIPGISQSAGTSYLYRVRALDPAGNPGGYSSPSLATTVVFADNPLISGTTIVKAVHVEQLRTAVNAVRTLAGLGSGTYTDGGPLVGVLVKAAHVQELRTNLDAARSLVGLPQATYTDSPLTGGIPITAEHVTQLRNGVE